MAQVPASSKRHVCNNITPITVRQWGWVISRECVRMYMVSCYSGVLFLELIAAGIGTVGGAQDASQVVLAWLGDE